MGEETHQSVQELAASLGALPPEFVRSEHDQPSATTYRGADAPMIDMSEPGFGARMAVAAREWGLFQVVNHGVPSAAVSELQRVGRAFFVLPREEKERYTMDSASGKIEGYDTKLQRDVEGKKTWNDFFFHVVAPPEKVVCAWELVTKYTADVSQIGISRSSVGEREEMQGPSAATLAAT